jgi:hypothetical protein
MSLGLLIDVPTHDAICQGEPSIGRPTLNHAATQTKTRCIRIMLSNQLHKTTKPGPQKKQQIHVHGIL